MSALIADCRVLTERPGQNGLGLEAQREAVPHFLHSASLLLSEFQEIESGKKHTNRPALAAALEKCRHRCAILVIAKLDRLARNVHFLSGFMQNGVNFVPVDMPRANQQTIPIMAAFAEHEREMISQRTKAGLATLKPRGVRLATLAGVRSGHGAA